MNGGVPSKELNETLLNILDQLESDSNLLDNSDNIKYIISLLQAGADPNVQNQAGKTLLDYLNEELRGILNQLAINSDLLDDSNSIQYIKFLLGTGANPNVQNQDEKTLLHYVAKRNDTGGIGFLLGKGANPNVQDQSGKTPLHYAAENNCLQAIKFLLQKGADPNAQDQSGKTPLHYAAENNCLQAIELLLKAKADQNMQDQSGKTPFEYVTEHDCLQAIEGLGCSSNDKTTCTKLSNSEEDSDYYSDGSCENEENPANNPSNYPNKHNDDQALRDDPGYSSGDDNKTISTEPSDCDRKDEDSSCSSSDYLFLEDSLSMELEIPLTTDEQELIDEFCKGIRGITAQNKQESEESILESIEEIVNEYLEKVLRLNSSCSNGNEKGDKETVTSLIFKEMEEVIAQLRVNPRSSTAMLNTHDYTDESDGDEYKTSDIIIKRITSNLLLKGGMGKKFLYGDTELTNKHYDFDYLNDLKKQYEDRKKELKSIACEGIVNKSKQTHEYDFKAEIDNVYFYVKYPQDSIIEPAKVLNHEKAKKLNLKVGILQIGESIVRVESIDEKRNYKDILKGSIKMSFTTEVGEISIYLSPSKEGGNKVEVEIDEKNKARLNKLKAEKKSLGENCLLGGKNVLEAIEDKGFKKNGNVPTESIETIKDVPRTDVTQACPQQIDTSAKGR